MVVGAGGCGDGVIRGALLQGKATVSLSAGVTHVRVPAVPVAPSSVSPSPQSGDRSGAGGAAAQQGTGIYFCDSFATDSLAELTANCNPKLSDGSFFQPGSVRNKFVWVIKTY